MKRILILLSFLAISCQSNSGEMPRQVGQASNELMDGLEAMHHVRFAEARALFLEGIEKKLIRLPRRQTSIATILMQGL